MSRTTTRAARMLATVSAAGLGAALAVVLVASPSTRSRTVTVETTNSGRTAAISQVRTVERVRTVVKTAAASSPARRRAKVARPPGRRANIASPPMPVAVHPSSAPGPKSGAAAARPQEFAGTGPRVLGRIVVGARGGRLRWANSGGRFRLQFNGIGVAVDSTAHSGQIAAPPFTYEQVTVDTQGSWIIQIS